MASARTIFAVGQVANAAITMVAAAFLKSVIGNGASDLITTPLKVITAPVTLPLNLLLFPIKAPLDIISWPFSHPFQFALLASTLVGVNASATTIARRLAS
jgi:hypothetical protein